MVVELEASPPLPLAPVKGPRRVLGWRWRPSFHLPRVQGRRAGAGVSGLTVLGLSRGQIIITSWSHARLALNIGSVYIHIGGENNMMEMFPSIPALRNCAHNDKHPRIRTLLPSWALTKPYSYQLETTRPCRHTQSVSRYTAGMTRAMRQACSSTKAFPTKPLITEFPEDDYCLSRNSSRRGSSVVVKVSIAPASNLTPSSPGAKLTVYSCANRDRTIRIVIMASALPGQAYAPRKWSQHLPTIIAFFFFQV